MDEIVAENLAVAGRRGKYHRESATYGVLVTACGKGTRDFTVERDIDTTAPEDRCRKCWPAGPVVAAGSGGEER